MNNKMILVYIIFHFVLVNDAFTDEPLKIRDLSGQLIPRIFVLDKDYPNIYMESTGNEISKNDGRMGEVYHGKAEENGRIYLVKYSHDNQQFTRELGWISNKDVIDGRNPIDVADAVKCGALPESELRWCNTAYTRQNALHLRVVSKPHVQLTVSNRPGENGNTGTLKFSWYYVYDIENYKDKIYYLLGTHPDLFDLPLVVDSERQKDSNKRIKGWVESSKVKEWCSNLVLEYNTLNDAVTERYKPIQNGNIGENALPARLFSEKNISSDVIAIEPLEIFWKAHFNQKDVELSKARVDPYGLDPNVPRFHVLEKEEGDDAWYRVATLGSIGEGKGLEVTEIAALKKELEDAVSAARTVDVVFVTDATGSMTNEVNAVCEFLMKLCDAYTATSKGRAIPFSLPGNRTFELDTGLNIQASIVAYQDIGALNLGPDDPIEKVPFCTKLLMKGRSLKVGRTHIDRTKGFFVQENMRGGTEALHQGISRSLSEPGIWRKNTNIRLIVIVADEPGDSGDEDQEAVLKMLPLPPEYDPQSNANSDQIKLGYTNIYAIYTDYNGFEEFKQNLRMLVSEPLKQIIHLPEFESANKNADRDSLIARLCEPLNQAQELIEARIKKLFDELRSENNSELNDNKNMKPVGDISVILDDLALKRICKEANTSLERLKGLTNVAFVDGWTQEKPAGYVNPVFRMRVALERRDILVIQDTSMRLAEGIDAFFRRKAEWSKIIGNDPRRCIAVALVSAVCAVTGDNDVMNNSKKLDELVNQLLGKESASSYLREFIGMKRSLPVSPKGILGMPIGDLVKLKTEDLNEQALVLNRKSKCLRNILDGLTSPEDFMRVEQAEALPKHWMYVHEESGNQFVYVPVQYLP